MWQQFLYKQRYEYICILKLDTNKNVNTFLWTIGYKWIYSYDKFDTNEYLNIFVFFNFLRFYHFLFHILFRFYLFLFLLCRTVVGWEQAGVGGSKVHFLYFSKCNIVFLAKATFLFLLNCRLLKALLRYIIYLLPF